MNRQLIDRIVIFDFYNLFSSIFSRWPPREIVLIVGGDLRNCFWGGLPKLRSEDPQQKSPVVVVVVVMITPSDKQYPGEFRNSSGHHVIISKPRIFVSTLRLQHFISDHIYSNWSDEKLLSYYQISIICRWIKNWIRANLDPFWGVSIRYPYSLLRLSNAINQQ